MATTTVTDRPAGSESSNRANSAVVARGLVREYRRGVERIRALKGIDITISQGEFVGVVGHSGAGKTTLLNLAGLMDRPTSGGLTVLGHDVGRSGAGMDRLRRENIGFVFQEFFLMPSLTALENVLLPALWSGVDRRQRARELLELVGLGRRVNHRPGELSGGEMQRVAVARALVNSPRLLLADEPTGNLDTKTRDEVLGLLAELNRDSGLTVVVATHDTGLQSRFARVIRLEDGEVADGR
jgi:putative ABC transport system ATP-binding protein